MIIIDGSITIQWMDQYEPYMKYIIAENRVLIEVVGMQPMVFHESIS
jgi:hypothetical protein